MNLCNNFMLCRSCKSFLGYAIILSLEKLNISMCLFYFSRKIVFVISVFGICCGCSISNRNIDKQISQNLADLSAIDFEDQVMAYDPDDASEGNVAKSALRGLSPVINPGMLINISVVVSGRDEINKENCNVSREGDVYLPLIKSVTLSGLTIVEAEKKLTVLCREYFVNPQVDISFSRMGNDSFVSPWGYVTVMGNVVNPQRIALPQGRKLKLSEAVTLTGGLAPSAKDRAVVLIRRAGNGKIIKQKVNLRSIVAKGKIDRDVELLPNDYIFVPETIF